MNFEELQEAFKPKPVLAEYSTEGDKIYANCIKCLKNEHVCCSGLIQGFAILNPVCVHCCLCYEH